MLDKILKTTLPVTFVILLIQTVAPNMLPAILNNYSILFLGLLSFSLGWMLTGFIYDKNSNNYDIFRRIALSAVFAVPLVAIIFTPSYLYPYIVGKGFVFRFLSLVAVCATIYLSFTKEEFRPKLSFFFVGYFIFALAMAVATIFSIDPGRSFWSNFERMEGYINVLALLGLTFSIVTLRLKELEWGKLFTVHLWVSSLIAILGLMQYFVGVLGMKGLSNFPILNLCLSQGAGCRIDATLGNSIYLGLYAALTFWIIIYAIFAKKIKSNILILLAVINLLVVFFTGTRGVIIGVPFGFVVLIISKFWFDGNKKAVATTILSGFLAITLFAGFIVYAKKNNIAQDIPIVQRFSSINTLFARYTIWQMAVKSAFQKPVFGWGQENFIHAFNLNYDPKMYGQETYFDHPHNTYLGWLVSGGIVGFFAFLYMLYTAIMGSIKSSLKKEEENDLVIPIILAFFATYLFHIFFVFDNLTSSLLLVFASVYFGTNMTYGNLNISSHLEKHKKNIAIVLILVFVLGTYFIVQKPALSNSLVIEAMTYSQKAGSQSPVNILLATQKLYQTAISMNTLGVYETREFYLQKSLEYIGLLPQVQDESTKNVIIALATNALEQFEIQIRENPFDHRARFMLGLYYLNIKEYDKSINTLKEAVALAPNKQIALVYLAKAYLFKGDIQNASILYEKAIDITPKSLAGHNQLRTEYIQVLLLANQDEKALKNIQELLPTSNREEFNSLVSQIMQVYSGRKDVKSVIKLLNDAMSLDPLNQNFPLWLAQAYLYQKDYNAAAFSINKLSTSNPELVSQFMTQLQDAMSKEPQNAAAGNVKK